MKADLLRKKFLDFFKAKKHKVVEPDLLAPKDDLTVLFTPAGMNQFKKEFLGFDSGFKRAATCQRCLRTDDLDKVGKTPAHHTMFEMLGNFSFGDYFKEEAIEFAWEFLTQELKIPKEKLWVSVYKDDIEAYDIWKDKIKVPTNKIVKLGDKENFWPSEAKAKGPNGPCGPCSEIFVDRGKDVGCKTIHCDPSCSCGRFVEVWNLVFTQFNRKEGGVLEPLPQKNIDTGMGLERLAAVMQNVESNFETDLFMPIIKEIMQGLSLRGTVPEKGVLYAIADHLRAAVFAIYDGILPSNEARGYVVRKLIRKAILHLRSLRQKQPFLYKLVPVLSSLMKNYYPELETRKENIAEIILAEENNFINTLNSSSNLFKDKFAPFLKNQNPEKAGIIAFQLHDTYGIPLELTKDWLDKQGIKISKQAFDKELSLQKSRSKAQSAMKGDVFDAKAMHLDVKTVKFLGYKECSTKAKILKIIKSNAEVKAIKKGEEATIIIDQTVFYPESGGQIADTGELIKGKNVFEVLDTEKVGKAIIHIGKVKEGGFKKNDNVTAKIDLERRLAIARNHTATHLLQAALRKVLGAHVKQQGSLVAQDKLRFDFTHFKDINQEELGRIEEIVNNYIMTNHGLERKEMRLAEAKKTGALAFFGEKYEDKVRVVSIGDFSKEFCGGTHLESTGQIGLFKITQEGSVAAGVRRIEAVTGLTAYRITKNEEETLADISSLLNVPIDKVTQEIEKINLRRKELEKQNISKKENDIKGGIKNDIDSAEVINGTKFIIHIDSDANSVRRAVDLIKEQQQERTFIFSSTGNAFENNIFWSMGASGDLCERGFDVSKLIDLIKPEIGGSGGGRKDFAQGGGKNPKNINKVYEQLKNKLKELL